MRPSLRTTDRPTGLRLLGFSSVMSTALAMTAAVAIPANWATVRDRWEYGHAVRACLLTGALAALVWANAGESSDSAAREQRR